MPLAFQSESHGTIAFGFFNIESDMLLLEELFFFADRFCLAVAGLAASDEPVAKVELQGWRIAERAAAGNLHGAIAGVDHSGFIGATYREWPFPVDLGGFKQQPEGCDRQARTTELIEPFGEPLEIPIVWDRSAAARTTVTVGPFVFSTAYFAELIAYVDRGGYPRWRDELRPGYVTAMLDRLAELGSPWLA